MPHCRNLTPFPKLRPGLFFSINSPWFPAQFKVQPLRQQVLVEDSLLRGELIFCPIHSPSCRRICAECCPEGAVEWGERGWTDADLRDPGACDATVDDICNPNKSQATKIISEYWRHTHIGVLHVVLWTLLLCKSKEAPTLVLRREGVKEHSQEETKVDA